MGVKLRYNSKSKVWKRQHKEVVYELKYKMCIKFQKVHQSHRTNQSDLFVYLIHFYSKCICQQKSI